MLKTILPFLCGIALLYACNDAPKASISVQAETETGKEQVIAFYYTDSNIQKNFDTLNYPGVDTASMIEQALANCYDESGTQVGRQDVYCSMYFDRFTQRINCLTTTTFRFKDGDIAATGMTELTPGSDTPPNDLMTITGGTKTYQGIYGIYKRRRSNDTFYVELHYKKLP